MFFLLFIPMINHLLSMQKSEPEYYTDEIIKGHSLVICAPLSVQERQANKSWEIKQFFFYESKEWPPGL
ncbi:unnamed protein product, partial [Vitis vinifera]